MNKFLLLILLLLMFFVDQKRGFKLFLSLCFNFIILMIMFYLISFKINPIAIALIGCFFISRIILYFVNERNVKTEASMKSIIIVLIILAILIFSVTNLSRIAGFGYESFEEINMFSYDVDIDFTEISIAIILIGLIGATVDSSIAISSALFEVYENNKHLTKKQLFISGLNIGKDILCTTANTLLFAFIGEFMTLLIWFKSLNYTFASIINAKVFWAEFIKILFIGIGCVLVIPITSYITTRAILELGEYYQN